MTDWASSGGVRIERAKKHVRDLKAEIATFFQGNPYEVVGEDDPNTGDWVNRARIHETPPIHWGAIAGDAIHNLRASLDILWHHMMLPSGGLDDADTTGFPIDSSPKGFKARHARKVRSSRKPIMDIHKALKPYKGGNDLLWLLHCADIIDKHRGLIPAYSTVGTTVIDFATAFRTMAASGEISWAKPDDLPPMYLGLNWARPACPVEDGAELWRVRAANRTKVDMNPKFPFTIAFGEATILKGKPIVATLDEFVNLVEEIVGKFTAAGLLT